MRFRLLTIAFLLVAVAPASAQQVITFDDAVRIALEQNVALRRAANSVDLQAATVRADKGAFLPNLNYSSSAGRNWGLQFDLTTGKLENESSDRFSTGANTSVNLFNGFGDVASLAQSRFGLAAQEQTYERSRQTVAFNVIQNYLQVILNREQIDIRKEDLTSQEQQLARIEEFVRVGTRPVSDLYQQQASLAASEAALLDAERTLQLSESRLIQTLQLDPLQSYTFQAPSADELPLIPRTYDADDLLRNAYDQRADLRAQEYAINASEQAIRVARSGLLPRLNLSAGINSSYSSFALDPLTRESKPFSSQLADNRSESMSFSLAIPIFNRHQTGTAIERAKVQLDNARLDLENLEQGVALEVRQAYLDYQTAQKRLDVTEKQLRAAQQALQVEQERYDVGASTLVELTQARSSFVNASSQRVQAIFQFHFQHRLIEYYQGILNPAESLF